MNAGLRYDYWFIGDYVTEAMRDPDILTITQAGREKYFEETSSFFGKRFKGHLSPRLGIGHPVTDNDVLYFNYGHFPQLPTYNYVYAKLNTVSDNPYNLIGNPNLNPKTTVAYEIGVKHKFFRFLPPWNSRRTIKTCSITKPLRRSHHSILWSAITA
ncbi:MAG: TonB-dependent receptor [Candidatus Marinimicrobia bacterium]|nr:TonB-dependent receptor [Candidatus Neomarinimicrobiota bacterium]